MRLPYKIGYGILLIGGLTAVAATNLDYKRVYERINTLIPKISRPVAVEPAVKPTSESTGVNRPLEERTSEQATPQQTVPIVVDPRENFEYLNRIANRNSFDFIDAKTGKNVNVHFYGSLTLITKVDGIGNVIYSNKEGGHGLGYVMMGGGGAGVEIGPKSIIGLSTKNKVGDTKPDVWKRHEAEYFRLLQATAEAAKKIFPGTSQREKKLADIVNQK